MKNGTRHLGNRWRVCGTISDVPICDDACLRLAGLAKLAHARVHRIQALIPVLQQQQIVVIRLPFRAPQSLPPQVDGLQMGLAGAPLTVAVA